MSHTGRFDGCVILTSIHSHLFSNFFVGFARSFGCTLPPAPLPKTNGPVSLAYAHKFMDLEYHQLGYFINQLSLAAVHYGASAQDADTFRSSMNSRFNVRCAPAFSSNPASPPQLMSLCQNPTCPLAVPVSDCAAYVNLTASGTANSNPTTVTSVATMTAAPSDRCHRRYRDWRCRSPSHRHHSARLLSPETQTFCSSNRAGSSARLGPTQLQHTNDAAAVRILAKAPQCLVLLHEPTSGREITGS
jgi:hypothetical protein